MAKEQPRLFAELERIARATSQAMPAEVYLLPNVNAFVARRGGVFGLGGRRVMGIGLPLIEALTPTQFAAVIAQEFGHYDSGDARLGPWIYKSRAAILRMLQNVSRRRSWLSKPLEWYGVTFLRLTHAISRRQEFIADVVAVRVAGARALGGALRALERADMGFGAYWQQELAPALDRGFRPPMTAGFAQFVAAPRIASQLDELVEQRLREGKADPYDTHPILRERLAALGVSTATIGDEMADDVRAITLLDDVPQLEQRLIWSLVNPGTPELKPIAWEEIPTRVLPVGWLEAAGASAPGLDGLTPAQLPAIAERLRADPQALARQLGIAAERASATLEAAIAFALVERMRVGEHGMTLTAAPGEPVVFRIRQSSGTLELLPFGSIAALATGRLSAPDWARWCDATQIADVDLGACVRAAHCPL